MISLYYHLNIKENMNRFQLFSLLLIILLLFTPTLREANQRNATTATSDHTSTNDGRQPRQRYQVSIGQAKQLEEKRRVPTGSNPLHNKR
ncbi:hypothetical protein ES332_A08G061700v1 [Gossypium tomentosum]|nr:hypothetical protein PVK06_026302 [Gossypium arboreum]TYI13499.1 hypothetical protein ES332_A08G061700v1 [Gossypium tomentosum]